MATGWGHWSGPEGSGRSDWDDERRVTVLPGGGVWRGSVLKGPVPCASSRGCVVGFSAASRRRLRLLMMGIDWTVYDCYFVTLTYHNSWGLRWQEWKRDLRTWQKRIDRWLGDRLAGDIWRLEFQRRGAPHYHVVLFVRRGSTSSKALSRACRDAWLGAVGLSDDVDARNYGVTCRPLSRYRGTAALIGYLVKRMGSEMTKDKQTAGGDEVARPNGRVWGHRGSLPVVMGPSIELDEEQQAAFFARVHARGVETGSWLWSNVSQDWAGASLITAAEDVANLLRGIISEDEQCEVDAFARGVGCGG